MLPTSEIQQTFFHQLYSVFQMQYDPLEWCGQDLHHMTGLEAGPITW